MRTVMSSGPSDPTGGVPARPHPPVWAGIPLFTLAILLLSALPPRVHAGLNAGARLAIDVRAQTSKRMCTGLRDDFASCDSIRTSLPTVGDFDAVVVLYNFTAVTNVVFALEWPADWVIEEYSRCSDFGFGEPAEGGRMLAYFGWVDPEPAEGGGGLPLCRIRGNATSPGCFRFANPYPEFPPYAGVSLSERDFLATTTSCIGLAPPDEACAYGSYLAADFEASPTVGIPPLAVNFSDRTPGAVSWYWEFGDGEASTERDPTHVYRAPGWYTVSLQASDGTAVDDTMFVNLVRIGRYNHYQTTVDFGRPHPLPFTTETEVGFTLLAEERVTLTVFDPSGRRVRTLADQRFTPGEHRLRWDGRDGAQHVVPAGVYFLRLETPGSASTRKVVLTR
jgi:hypothetical protein